MSQNALAPIAMRQERIIESTFEAGHKGRKYDYGNGN